MKLIQTGQWYWRRDELSMKQFTLLNKKDKEEYLVLLKGLNPDERSTIDNLIINNFSPEINKVEKFLEL